MESAWFPTSDTTPDEVSSWESHYMVEEERRWQWEANLKASLHWLEEKVDRLLNPVVNPFSLETPGPLTLKKKKEKYKQPTSPPPSPSSPPPDEVQTPVKWV